MDNSILDQYIIGRVEPQIYAFSTGTVPNYLKVGDTYRPVEQRLDEWRKYFPDLEEEFAAISKVDEEIYFRDFAVHYFLEHDKQLHRLLPTDMEKLPYYSKEFFEYATDKDVAEAIHDIKKDFESNKGKYQFYTFKERPTQMTFTYKRGDKMLELRPNQKKTVANFTKAVKKNRNNLLMYAVMRFGKTFTALSCALSCDKYMSILVVSGKADVKQEWKKTVEGIKNFEGFDFIDSDLLLRNSHAINEALGRKHRAVVFLTLQDLNGEAIKKKHQDVFSRKWDMLIIDETHYGARAVEYGKVLRGSKKELKAEMKYAESSDDYENNDELKLLRAVVRIHLSGTPYRILMGSEFRKEDIIAFYQFSDIVKDKEKWDTEHIGKDDCNEWDNPYYGFPQMIRFAFQVNASSMKRMEEMRKNKVEYALNELLRPKATMKSKDGLHRKFVYEQEMLDLLMAIDGSKEDDNILGFLNDERIKRGKLCRHIVCVLPYRASCDALESLIKEHQDEFKNLGQYEILNITGVENEGLYKDVRAVKDKIENLERLGKKTITLTVNRMLTGTTVEQWDTMIYLKDTASPQEYDQAIFRLQNQYIREYKDEEGHAIKYNMKPQTLLVDFEPGRMFRMQEAKAQIYNVNTDKKGNTKLNERISEELRISPIIVVNKDKMKEVEPNDILDAVNAYSANKSIMDEATDIPVDADLLLNDAILAALESLYPIDAKKGIKMPANKGEGDELDTDDSSCNNGREKESGNADNRKKKDVDEAKELQKKLSTFYSLILFFAFLTDSKVASLDDVIKLINAKDNKRIAGNIGLAREVLQTIRSLINPFVLSDLDYKISHMNQLAHDASIPVNERVERAMRKFGRLSTSEIVTPSWVAEMMVGYLPTDKIKKGMKILDIAAKQGEFAVALCKAYGDKVRNSIYSLPTSSLTYEFTRKVYALLGLPISHVIADFNTYDLLNDKKKDILMSSLKQMNIGLVLGNPPYQDNSVGEQRTYNGPLYNLFLDKAYEMSGIVEMIHPARFLTNAGSTPKAWNKKMLEDKHFKVLSFHQNAQELFENLQLTGGLAVTYRDLMENYSAINTFMPYPELDSICKKVSSDKNFKSMSDIVVSRTAYRFTDFMHAEHPEALAQLSKGHPYDVSTNIFERLPQLFYDDIPNDGKEYIALLGRLNNKRTVKYIQRNYIRPVVNLDGYKLFLSKADGAAGQIGNPIPARIIGKPEIGAPGIGNTESFISIGKCKSEYEVDALFKYISTKFARALLGALKTTQDITPEKWKFVPQQDFSAHSDIDWSLSVDEIDVLLFDKYNLSEEERKFIKEKVQTMDVIA